MGLDEFLASVLTTSTKEARGMEVLPRNLYRKERDAKLRAVLFLLYAIRSEEVWEDMGQILLCGEGATEYYDLVSTFLIFLNKKEVSDLTGSLTKALDKFCTEVTEEVYCKMFRSFTLKYCSHNGTLYSHCAILHLIVMEWYQRGMQSCGWKSSRVSLFQQADVTLLEIIVLLFELNFKNPKGYYPVRSKDVRAVKSVLGILNSEDFVEDFVKTMKVNTKSVDFNTITNASVYSAIENLFSPERQANVCLHFLNIKREDFSKGNLIDGATKAIVQGTGVDVLKYRKLFVREDGVTLQFHKPFDRITEVTLREVHREELHYILVRYCLHGKYDRDLVLNIEDLGTSFMTYLYEIDFSLTIGILCWLGLKELLISGLEVVELLRAYPDVKDQLVDLVEGIALYFEDENLYYSKPIWWNYEQAKARKKGQAVELTKLVNVGTYSRRLPKGQQASEKAKALAKKYCMILETGYTLVEGFERKQKVKKKGGIASDGTRIL